MPILRIHDAQPGGGLAFDLRDILAVLQPRAGNAEWEVYHADEEFWVTGEDTRAIEALVGSGERVPGKTLSSLANEIHQVIWGEFRAFDGAAAKPWVIVRAIDSSYFEIETDDDALAALVQQHFNVVQSAA